MFQLYINHTHWHIWQVFAAEKNTNNKCIQFIKCNSRFNKRLKNTSQINLSVNHIKNTIPPKNVQANKNLFFWESFTNKTSYICLLITTVYLNNFIRYPWFVSVLLKSKGKSCEKIRGVLERRRVSKDNTDKFLLFQDKNGDATPKTYNINKSKNTI